MSLIKPSRSWCGLPPIPVSTTISSSVTPLALDHGSDRSDKGANRRPCRVCTSLSLFVPGSVALTHRANPARFIECNHHEAGFRYLVQFAGLGLVWLTNPHFDVDLDRAVADFAYVSEDIDYRANPHGAQKIHGFNGDSGSAAMGFTSGCQFGCLVHMAYQPAAGNIAIEIGILPVGQ